MIQRQMFGGRDNGNIPDAGLHEYTYWIIDHGLVIDRHKLFAHAACQRIKPCSGATCEYNTFPLFHDLHSLRIVAANPVSVGTALDVFYPFRVGEIP